MAGKVSVPVPSGAFNMTLNTGRRIGMPRISPDFRRLLRFGRAVDISRLVDEVGYTPRFSSTEAVEDYVSHQGGRRLIPSLRQLAVGT
jgi:UDP-glucose 4-epimerase